MATKRSAWKKPFMLCRRLLGCKGICPDYRCKMKMTRMIMFLGLFCLFIVESASSSLAFEKQVNGVLSEVPARKSEPFLDQSKSIPQNLKPYTSNRKISGELNRLLSRRTAARYTAVKEEKVRVILNMASTPIDLDAIRARGGRILNEQETLVAAEVPINAIEDIVNNVSGVEYARLPRKFFPCSVTSEGVSLTGAGDFQEADIIGTGTKVAVIDVGFKGLPEAQSTGDIPYNVTTLDYTGKGLQTQYKHGTGCAEIIYDMAPDAELYCIKVTDEVDIYNAFNYCIDNGIDIISASIGTFGIGPGNGTGALSDLCNDARENGILVVAAAGNHAVFSLGGTPVGTHWKGIFRDSDGWTGTENDLHQFIAGDPGSYYNAIAAKPHQDDDGNPRTNDLTVIMRWDDWPKATVDYDIYLFDYNTGALVDYSNVVQDGSHPPLEAIIIDLPDSEDYLHYYTLVISKPSGEPAGIELELCLGGKSYFIPFDKYSLIATSSSSIVEPADTQSVLAVGAINYSNWATGPQEDFSSQGPTNAWAGSSARVKPDICGPDGVSGYTYGDSSFLGTSAATPHVAGAAALILSMHPHFGPDELQSTIESNAIDMGAGGKDNSYGWGRLHLAVLNDPPILEYVGDKTINEGQTLSFTVSGSDADGDTIIYSATNLPLGASFDPATHTFTWIPNSQQAGVYHNILFEISDAVVTDSEGISITVNNFCGDINDDVSVDLTDAILALQIVAGLNPDGAHLNADVNGDGKIGIEEVVYILQHVALLR